VGDEKIGSERRDAVIRPESNVVRAVAVLGKVFSLAQVLDMHRPSLVDSSRRRSKDFKL